MVYMPYNRHINTNGENDMDNFNVEFYVDDDGKEPAKDFISGLSGKMESKMLGELDLLSEYGNQLREPYTKHIQDGIFELRVKVKTDITRVLYFFYYEKRIILTNGFVKKTLKTPKREIEFTKKYRKRFIERGGINE